MTIFNSFPIEAKRISELVSLAVVETGDKIPLVEASSNTTKYALVEDLRKYFAPSNVVVVNSAADFPAAVAGKRTLANGVSYVINTTTVISDTLVIPAGGSVQITSSSLSKALVYSGTGTMFEATSNFGIFNTHLLICQAPNGTFFDFGQVTGSFYGISSIFANAVSAGTVKNSTFTLFFAQTTVIGTGFVFENNASQVSFSHTANVAYRNVGTTMLTFKGNIVDIALFDNRIVPTSNDKALDYQPTLETFGTNLVMQSTVGLTSGAGQIFATNSLKQDYIKSNFFGNIGISDSTTTASNYYESNALATTIATINTPTVINTLWGAGSSSKERMLLQDICTFDATTDIITCRNIITPATATNHGMANGDSVFFKAGTGGTLPTELVAGTRYYVINATATTFQVSATSGGAAINLSSNGTGTNYFRHATGLSSSGWLIYIGQEAVKVKVAGQIQAVTSSGGAGDNLYTRLIRTSSTFVETPLSKSPDFNVASGKPNATSFDDLVDLVNGEGLRLYIANATGTAAVTSAMCNFIVSK